jgi:iron complex outermembrane receptor protein
VSVPRDKLILNADWKVSRFHSHLRVTRYGSYVESGTSPVGDREFGAKWITDLELGYDLSEHFTLAVGANNLFDVYPDKHGIIDAYGDNQYGMYAPFGLSGGFYYARAEANF